MGVAGNVGQALTHDSDDVVGQVGVDAAIELVDDDQFVVQVRVDRLAVERNKQRGSKSQR